MSGPNDSGAGETANGEFKLPLGDAAPKFSDRFRLRVRWETPHLEWRPTQATPTSPLAQPALLRLDDPFAAVLDFERYMLSGALLFDTTRLRFDLLDKAYLDAPTVSPSTLRGPPRVPRPIRNPDSTKSSRSTRAMRTSRQAPPPTWT